MSGPDASPASKRQRHIKFVVLTVILTTVAYIGIHGALRGWELQRRLICASNIKGVGTAAKIYATSAWDGATPITDWLIQSGQITAQQTKCPSAGSANYVVVMPPPGEVADNRTIIAYEPKSNHGGEGGNVVFADGHANFVPVPVYDELIASIPRARP